MILYSVFNGEDTEWFAAKKCAIKRARALRKLDEQERDNGSRLYSDHYVVSRNTIDMRGRELALAILNQSGFVAEHWVVFSTDKSAPATGDR